MAWYRVCNLSDIRPYERNPRVITEDAVSAVAKSIAAFGFLSPICVDKDGVILAGHTRYLAAKSLGLDKVPVLWASELDGARAAGYRIADNKTGELSFWDRDLLIAEAGEIFDEANEIVGAIGLSDWEIAKLVERVLPACSPAEDDEGSATSKSAGASKTCADGFDDSVPDSGALPEELKCGRVLAKLPVRCRPGDAFRLGGATLNVGGDAVTAARVIVYWQSLSSEHAMRVDGVPYCDCELV